MLFWMFGLLYFHGKWIRFCRDGKFSGTVLEDKESKKYFNPLSSVVFFMSGSSLTLISHFFPHFRKFSKHLSDFN